MIVALVLRIRQLVTETIIRIYKVEIEILLPNKNNFHRYRDSFFFLMHLF